MVVAGVKIMTEAIVAVEKEFRQNKQTAYFRNKYRGVRKNAFFFVIDFFNRCEHCAPSIHQIMEIEGAGILQKLTRYCHSINEAENIRIFNEDAIFLIFSEPLSLS